MTRPLVLALAFALGAGCTGAPPETIDGCEDAACREAFVLRVFDAGGEPAPLLKQLPGPEERIAVVMKLSEAHPGRTATLCRELPKGAARSRCERINARPHLHQTLPNAARESGRPGGGPSGTTLLPPDDLVSVHVGASAQPATCDEPLDTHTCQAQQAKLTAAAGDHDTAAAMCMAVSQGTWRDECMFRAAEDGLAAGSDGYGPSVELCLASGEFVGMCLGHLSMELAKATPDATALDPQAWAPVIAVAASMQQWWQSRHADFGALALDRFWSDALFYAYATTPEATGAPLALLPAEAAPHLRASMVTRLMRQDPGAATDLAGWMEEAQDALAATPTTRAEPTTTSVTKDRPFDLWPRDMDHDAQVPAAFYLGTARRAVSADPAVDLAICVLEAGYRYVPDRKTLVQSAMGHADETVRWTAERLSRATTSGVPPEGDGPGGPGAAGGPSGRPGGPGAGGPGAAGPGAAGPGAAGPRGGGADGPRPSGR